MPSIVNEFLRQAKDAGLVAAFVDPAAEDAIESDLSRTFGGINRLDTFFPFDPYLLKESDRFAPLTLLLLKRITAALNHCSLHCSSFADYNV